MSCVKLEAELAEVSKLREKLYWEFTRGKNSPPVPAEVTRRYYEITEQLNKARHARNATMKPPRGRITTADT